MRSDVGKIMIPRKILNEIEMGKSPSCRNLFLWLLINCNFSASKTDMNLGSKKRRLKVGEIFTMHKEMAKQTKMTVSSNRDNLRYLERLGLISSNSYPKSGILIKVNNYEALTSFEASHEHNQQHNDWQNDHNESNRDNLNIRTKEELKQTKSISSTKLEKERNEFADFWNRSLVPPFARIETWNKQRISMFEKVIKKYGVEDMKIVAQQMSESEFFQNQFKLTIESFLRPTKFQEKLERYKTTYSETHLTQDDIEFFNQIYDEVQNG